MPLATPTPNPMGILKKSINIAVVNFTNNLQAAFVPICLLQIQKRQLVWLPYRKKSACKMLVKLTPALYLIFYLRQILILDQILSWAIHWNRLWRICSSSSSSRRRSPARQVDWEGWSRRPTRRTCKSENSFFLLIILCLSWILIINTI